MKLTALTAAAIFVGTFSFAQTGVPATPVTDTTVVSMVDTSVGKAYITNAERLMALTSETLTPAHIFPALGTFKGNGSSEASVTISLDETNKGIVWVEGLPQGRFKAIMKKAPSTYKIPAQKSESGKAIAEGALYVNPETGELTISVGQSFNEKQPTAFVSVTKQKGGWRYTGVKQEAEAVETTPVPQQ